MDKTFLKNKEFGNLPFQIVRVFCDTVVIKMIWHRRESSEIELHIYENLVYNTLQIRFCHSVNEAGSIGCPNGKNKITPYPMLYTKINTRGIKCIKWKFILIRTYGRMSLWYQDREGYLKAQIMIEKSGRLDNIQILKPLNNNNKKIPHSKRKTTFGWERKYLQYMQLTKN